MGRTTRRRGRRKKPDRRVFPLGSDPDLVDFTKWLTTRGWRPSTKQIPALFPGTGRGLRAQERINSGEIIAKIPVNLLITVKTASESLIGFLFHDRSFGVQQVLAAFVVFEKHVGEDSTWFQYFRTLPGYFSSPLFLPPEELEGFPEFVAKRVRKIRGKCEFLYEDLRSLTVDKKCPHCEVDLVEIFTKEEFFWGYFIVNSRAVYFSPDYEHPGISLYDPNNLALAPYLDLFNHSNKAKVQAFILESEGTYCLKTLVPFKKYEEIFIHYGAHPNLNLYIEYGFILPDNSNDSVPLKLKDITLSADTECSSNQYKFLQNHDLLSNLYLNSEGLSYNAKIVIFLLLFPNREMKTIYRKIFSEGFSREETDGIKVVGLDLVHRKSEEFRGYIQKIRDTFILDDTISLCVDLLSVLGKVLDQSKVSIEEI